MDATERFIAAQNKLFERVGLKAESRFLEIPSASGRAHILVSGSGPPLVMVAGLGDPAAFWAPLMARLGGFTLYAVDRPCFGLSGRAVHSTSTIRTLAVEFLSQVLDALGLERPPIVANSMGSLWSIWLALDRPDRVAAMVHVGCPALFPGTSAPLPMRLLSVPPVGRLLMKLDPPSHQQVDRFAAMAGEDLSSLPEVKDVLVEMQKLPGVASALIELLHAVIRLSGPRPEVALTEAELARISQPTQIIWGERDPFGSIAAGKRAAGHIPNAEFHVFPEGGHVPWVVRPDAVARIAGDFLARQ